MNKTLTDINEAQGIFAEMDESFAAIDRILERPSPNLIELEHFAAMLLSETRRFVKAIDKALEG